MQRALENEMRVCAGVQRWKASTDEAQVHAGEFARRWRSSGRETKREIVEALEEHMRRGGGVGSEVVRACEVEPANACMHVFFAW